MGWARKWEIRKRVNVFKIKINRNKQWISLGAQTLYPKKEIVIIVSSWWSVIWSWSCPYLLHESCSPHFLALWTLYSWWYLKGASPQIIFIEEISQTELKALKLLNRHSWTFWQRCNNPGARDRTCTVTLKTNYILTNWANPCQQGLGSGFVGSRRTVKPETFKITGIFSFRTKLMLRKFSH